MRIAIIAEVYLPKIDGVVVRTLNLIRELQASGDDLIVICASSDGTQSSPVQVVQFPSFPFPLYPEYQIGRPDQSLIAALEDFKPDVVHFLNPFAFGFQCYDLLSSARFNVPTVFSFHTLYAEFVKRYSLLRPLSGLLWWLTKHYHNKADVNLTVSEITRQQLIAAKFERVNLWQPAVDSELFHPGQQNAEMRARLAGNHGCKYQLLTVSRLAPEKNVEFLADVLRNLPDTALAIVGDGPHRASLESHFAGLPVTFVGYLKDQQLAQAYASSDAFVYASETETMGNVVLEAMASGLPVVAPRAGGIPSLVTHNQSGLLFTPGDATTAEHFTRMLLFDDEARLRLTKAANDFACNHGWRDAAARVRRDYLAAVARSDQHGSKLSRPAMAARFVTRALVDFFRIAAACSSSAKTNSGARSIINPTDTESRLDLQGRKPDSVFEKSDSDLQMAGAASIVNSD